MRTCRRVTWTTSLMTTDPSDRGGGGLSHCLSVWRCPPVDITRVMKGFTRLID